MLFIIVLSTRIPNVLSSYNWSKNSMRIFGFKRYNDEKYVALAEFKGQSEVLQSLGGRWSSQGNVYVGYFPFDDPLAKVLYKHHLASAYPVPGEFISSLYITKKSEVKDVLKEMYELGITAKVSKVIRLRPYAGLSQRQLEAIRVAYSLGYFDFPKKANINDVAKTLGVTVSTAAELLRRAQKRLVEAYLRGVI